MKKFMILAVAASILSVGSAHALDKEKFYTHFRKAFNLDSKVPISAADPVPSKFGDLQSFIVTIQGQQQMVYMTKDERYYFWGTVLDMSTDPDKDRSSKINLTNVHIKGPKAAPVTIVEFSDLQCPNCVKAHSMVDEQLFKDYAKGQIRLVFKHFPLTMHEWAESGAVAVECAARDGGNDAFWKMTDTIFKNSETITPQTAKEKFVGFAGDLKLDKNKFKACQEDPAILAKIKKDKEEGMQIGVNATPSFVINGRMVRGNRYEDVKSVIDEKLAESKK